MRQPRPLLRSFLGYLLLPFWGVLFVLLSGVEGHDPLLLLGLVLRGEAQGFWLLCGIWVVMFGVATAVFRPGLYLFLSVLWTIGWLSNGNTAIVVFVAPYMIILEVDDLICRLRRRSAQRPAPAGPVIASQPSVAPGPGAPAAGPGPSSVPTAAGTTCPSCGATYLEGERSRFCHRCGAPRSPAATAAGALPAAKPRCQRCGRPAAPSSRFCYACGAALAPPSTIAAAATGEAVAPADPQPAGAAAAADQSPSPRPTTEEAMPAQTPPAYWVPGRPAGPALQAGALPPRAGRGAPARRFQSTLLGRFLQVVIFCGTFALIIGVWIVSRPSVIGEGPAPTAPATATAGPGGTPRAATPVAPPAALEPGWQQLASQEAGVEIALPPGWRQFRDANELQQAMQSGLKDNPALAPFVRNLSLSDYALFAVDTTPLGTEVCFRSLSVRVLPAPPGYTQASLAEAGAKALEKAPGLLPPVAQSRLALPIGEVEVVRSRVRANSPGGGTSVVANTQYCLIRDGKEYLLTCGTCDSDAAAGGAIFDKMLATFRIIK